MSQNPQAAFIAKNPKGAQSQLQLDNAGGMQVFMGHALRYGIGYSKRAFAVSTQAAVTTSAGLATAYTGLCLSNPAGSTVNLSVFGLSAIFPVAPTGQTQVALVVGYAPGGITAHTTPATPISTFLGSGIVPQALADTACTLVGTPVFSRWLGSINAAGAVVPDLQGGLIVPPGGYVAIGTSIASAANGFLGSFEWEECAP